MAVAGSIATGSIATFIFAHFRNDFVLSSCMLLAFLCLLVLQVLFVLISHWFQFAAVASPQPPNALSQSFLLLASSMFSFVFSFV